MKLWSLLAATLMLGGAWGTITMIASEEPKLRKQPFAEFPLELPGGWKGTELGLDEKVLAVLRLDDYMMRVYRKVPESDRGGIEAESSRENHPGNGKTLTLAHRSQAVPARMTDHDGGEVVPVWLYVGYYGSQRTGVTYHSPKNCLPGAGWQVMASHPLTVAVPGGRSITINNVLIQKGLDRQVILYWYHDRGRVIASEYWAKAYLIWDALTHTRTDGALVRLSIPVTTTAEQAVQVGIAFLQDLWPVLLQYMPDPLSPSV